VTKVSGSRNQQQNEDLWLHAEREDADRHDRKRAIAVLKKQIETLTGSDFTKVEEFNLKTGTLMEQLRKEKNNDEVKQFRQLYVRDLILETNMQSQDNNNLDQLDLSQVTKAYLLQYVEIVPSLP